jgi:hypothetical protein
LTPITVAEEGVGALFLVMVLQRFAVVYINSNFMLISSTKMHQESNKVRKIQRGKCITFI